MPLDASGPDAGLALDHAARDAVRPALTVLTPVYLVLAVLHPVMLAPPGAYVMSATALATAALTGGAWLALVRRGTGVRRGHLVMGLLAALVLVNSVLHLFVIGEAADTTNLLLLIGGSGFILLSRRWLLALILLAWAGWGGAAVTYPAEPWSRYLAAMIGATVLAWLVHAVRVQTILNLQHLRAQLEVRVEERTHALAASNAYLRTLVDHLPDAICIRDAQGVHRLANDAARALLGGDALVGTRNRDVRPPDQVELEDAEDASVLWTGEPILERSAEVAGADGTVRRVVVSKYPMRSPTGEVTGVLDLRRDVTEATRAEQARQDMEHRLFHVQKLQSLGVLTGGIAHDFNNLLTSVLGAASLIRLDALQPARVEAHVRHVETAAHQAADLCRQLLAYAGQGRVLAERADLGVLVEEVVPLLRMSASRRVEVQVQRAPGPLPFHGDTSQMRQVVMNLVINAAEAVADRPDGVVRVACGEVVLNAGEVVDRSTSAPMPAGHYGYIEVADNGVGLSADLVDRIFDPFFTTKFTGRGLGLAVVLGIARGHGGTVLVRSQPAQGATFRVLVPLVAARGSSSDTPVAQAGSAALSGDVLLIDDERAVLEVIGSMLERLGFTVSKAGDASEGLAIFTTDPGRYRVLVVDLTMPGGGGREVLRQLRAAGHVVPVLLVSGYADGDIVLAEIGDLHARFLQKPFRLDALRDALGALLRTSG